jgi:hypothetical protein
MRFPMPLFPCEFELPNDWLVEAGWLNDAGQMIFQPAAAAYPSTPDARLIPLKLVEPLGRDRGYGKDFRGFDRARMMKILKGFVAGDIIEAPEAIQLPDDREVCRGQYRYRICNGVHRYFASIAAGYTLIPLRL